MESQCCFPIIKVLFVIKAVYLRRVFKIQKNICAVLSQIASGEACVHDKRTKREKERPERAVSSEPRATPWVSVYKRLRPVRAKVWANGWLLLLPLQGVGNGDMIPRALPWAMNLLGFQPAQSRRQGFPAQSSST